MKEIDTEEATSSENSTISNGKNNENVVSESDTNSIKQLNNLIGLQSVKKQVNSIINMIKIDKRLEAQGGTPPKGRSLHMVFLETQELGKQR